LKRVPLVFPQRQEATTADHRHQRKLLHDINTEWKTNSPRPARIHESFELAGGPRTPDMYQNLRTLLGDKNALRSPQCVEAYWLKTAGPT
jgi:hypothetical protein